MTTVEDIKKIKFSQLPHKEKIEIKRKGRPTPEIVILQRGVSKNKTYIRSFHKEWYKKIQWLCGCEINNALFCFPCLLYGGDSQWTDSGFTRLNRLKENSEKHANSKRHIENVVSLSFLGQTNISKQLTIGKDYRIEKLKHNEQVKKNRDILSKVIECIKFCVSLGLREHNEDDSSKKPEVFKYLINFIATFDPLLQNHLDCSLVFKKDLKTIQNELLRNMLEVCQERILSEIKESSYLAVMADEATDISEVTQTIIVFRYELNAVVYERFWGLFDLEKVDENSISKCILDEIHKVLKNDSSKLIAQSYDGAMNFMKDEQESVQDRIQMIYKNAHYVHCYAHRSNLVLKHVLASIKSVRLFFASLSGISVFFSKFPQILEKLINNHKSSNINWKFNENIINTVFENKYKLIRFFKELQSTQTVFEIIRASTEFLHILEDNTFSFWLEFYHNIMPHVERLFEQMQSRDIDASKIQEALDEFCNTTSNICNSSYYESANMCTIVESQEICDLICEGARQRFAFTNHLIAAKLFYREYFPNYRKKLPTSAIEESCNIYSDLVQNKLETELRVFYSKKELHNFDGLCALLRLITEKSLSTVFSETIKLIKILVTIPMSTIEPQRCFSTFKKIRTFLGNDMNHERLTALSIFIETNMVSDIENYNEKVIEKFCQSENQKMDFVYK